MALNTYRKIVDAELEGRTLYRTWRKTPTQVTTIGIWFDLSMSPGNPAPNYYASSPMVAAAMSRSNNGGLDHGGNVSPSQKVLRKISIMSQTAGAIGQPLMLCDYLLYYPFIDEGETSEQVFDNTVTLPRYTDGKGVQVMAVVVAGQTGGQTFSIRYTNQDGVADRVSPVARMTTQALNGTLISSARTSTTASGPFLALQEGDTGVRSIQGITFQGADVGLITLVLVKPLFRFRLAGIDAPVEVDPLKDFSVNPIIVDDAYLNLICMPSGSLSSAPIHGDIEVAWG